jgi:hypothetical protein
MSLGRPNGITLLCAHLEQKRSNAALLALKCRKDLEKCHPTLNQAVRFDRNHACDR